MVKRFGDDRGIAVEYINFCKYDDRKQGGDEENEVLSKGQNRRLSSLYATALRLHPLAAGLWIDAASHEFFGHGSARNARMLLQRGLRAHGTSETAVPEELWLQHFVLELHVIQRLKGRAIMLKQNPDVVQEEEDVAAEKTYNGSLAKIVYEGALEATKDRCDSAC